MTEPQAILRPDDKGRPDDIVIDCTAIHFERMNKGHWYLGVWRGDKCVKFAITATKKRCRIEVEPYDDELGLRDDTPDWTPERIEAEVAAAQARIAERERLLLAWDLGPVAGMRVSDV